MIAATMNDPIAAKPILKILDLNRKKVEPQGFNAFLYAKKTANEYRIDFIFIIWSHKVCSYFSIFFLLILSIDPTQLWRWINLGTSEVHDTWEAMFEYKKRRKCYNKHLNTQLLKIRNVLWLGSNISRLPQRGKGEERQKYYSRINKYWGKVYFKFEKPSLRNPSGWATHIGQLLAGDGSEEKHSKQDNENDGMGRPNDPKYGIYQDSHGLKQ
jgi:hypothetical protein